MPLHHLCVRGLLLWSLLLGACAPATLGPHRTGALRPTLDRLLDDWHQAAARADAQAYFGKLTRGAVFIGTDASERWTREQFQGKYAGHFRRGKAWTFRPLRRHMMISEGGDTAWFDEQLTSKHMGQVRGSGVLVRTAAGWRIAHYVLSFAVPNALARQLSQKIAAHGKSTKP